MVSGSVLLVGGVPELQFYSKPTNVFLSAPLLLEPLLVDVGEGLGNR